MCISINVGIIYLLTAFYATHTNDHEETKNTWARDDPAILILMTGGMFGKFPRASDSVIFSTSHDCSRGHCLVRSLVLWPIRCHSTGIFHGISGFPPHRSSMCHPVVVRFISRYSLSPIDKSHRFFANRALLSPPSHSSPADSAAEWAYAFDVHINAFFPLYLTLYIAQLFLVPIILKRNWVCLWVGNTFYLVA